MGARLPVRMVWWRVLALMMASENRHGVRSNRLDFGGVWLAVLLLAFAGVWPTSPVGFPAPSRVAARGVLYHGVNQAQLQQCLAQGQDCLKTVSGLSHRMRVYKVCNLAAAPNNRLAQTVPAGTNLLIASQVLRNLGVDRANKSVARATAVLNTYGALHAKDPALAASDTINPSRPGHLVTDESP